MSSPSVPPEPVAAPASRWRRLGRGLAKGLLALALLAGFAWTATALAYQVPPAWRTGAMAAAGIVALALLVLGFRRPTAGWAGFAVAALAVGLWWGSIAPSNDRDWAPDVARGVTGTFDGSKVTLHNVRNFRWSDPDTFTGGWETRTYDLDQLSAADLFSSVWASPAIAHTLIGFGFADGQRVVFSVEIRRERGEVFSEVGGFFKDFELVLIAADENDIVRLRTDARGETVSLYPLKISQEQMRKLFLSYVVKGNMLAARPQFYQTVTTNCTTVIFHLARIVEPNIPLDWRILVSGYLPGYLYEHGVIRTDLPLDEVMRRARIVRDPARDKAEDFSASIRK